MAALAILVTCAAIGGILLGELGARNEPATPVFPKPALVHATQAAYPLRVSANKRYLVDRNNAPFLIVGDSPQSMIVNLSTADAEAFLADRRAAGFNALWVNLLCDTYTGGRSDGATYDGIRPFSTTGDLSTPNDAYFNRADDMIWLAAKYGFVVFLDPIETGGWLQVLRTNGQAKDYNFGLYLGKRYRRFPNIVWMSGNDFQTWRHPGDDAVAQAVARGIRAADPQQLQTVELDYNVSGSLDDPTWAPLVDLNAAYTYYPTYADVLREYNRPSYKPTFMVEANYEFEHNTSFAYGSPQILRRQEYWTMLSGVTGQFYGNHYTWQFISDWKKNLDTVGSAQMTLMRNLFIQRAWYRLIPDQHHTVVTTGYGTFTSSGNLSDSDYATAARTPDGSLAMVYVPTLRTITVDMSKMSGRTLARWYDPTNGRYTTISGSPFANRGMKEFTPPGNNGSGDGDWILVLERSTGPAPRQR